MVTVNGRRAQVDVADTAYGWSLLLETGAGERRAQRSYDVAVEDRDGGDLLVHVNGRQVPVSRARAAVRRAGHVAAAAGALTVLAPMPGRIVKVLVEPGETLADGQPVVVLEAMKMQNEVRAPRGGRVEELRAVAGTLVEAGAVLVVLGDHRPSGER